MTYDELIVGLKERGFENINDICNKGHCHLDERHFILLTDGLVIYSNFWNWNCNEDWLLKEIWCLEQNFVFDPNTRLFSFQELDVIIR